MDFKKFTSIENSYRQKFVDKFHIDPETMFIGTEKLDGANIQLLFQPDKEMIVGKRTSYLTKEDNFFDIWNTLERYKKETNEIQEWCNKTARTARLFGEIYGPGINGRVDYGTEKKIAIFDLHLDEVLCSQFRLLLYAVRWDIEHLLPQRIIKGTLEQCMAYDVENMPRKDCEGIVIQPYSEKIENRHGERFILKKKSKKFEDVRVDEINKGAGRAEPKENDIIYMLNKQFRQYITKNRVIDIFAKHGQISEMKQIGHYIILVLEDAKADFVKDVVLPEMDKKKEKDLYNVGSLIVDLLKEHL